MIFLVTSMFLLSGVNSDNREFNLLKVLKNGYSGLVRPVKSSNETVSISLAITLQQIVDVDEKNQIIYLNAWLNYEWTDYRLKWNKTDYGGVEDVRFKHGYLWKPDIFLYNSVDSSFDSTYPSNMIVTDNGDITWIPPGIFQVSCPINIKWFPFDEQRCHLIFGSWSYDGRKLDLKNSTENGFVMSEYLENGEWKIQGVSVERVEKCYSNGNGTRCYPRLHFYLNLRRRTLYYGFNLIIPGLVIVLMTILNFTLPPEAGEKLTLSTTILLAVCFFLNILSSTLPQTSSAVPLLGAFFSACMFLVSMAVVQAVICQNFHYRTPDTHEMSHFTRSVLLYWLPWFLRMKRPDYKFEWKTLPNPFQQKREIEETSVNQSESLLRNIRGQEDFLDIRTNKSSPEIGRRPANELEQRIHSHIDQLSSQQEKSITNLFHYALCLMMQQAHSELLYITKRLTSEDEDSDSMNDWKFAALVIDRFSLFLFTIMIIACSCGILFSAPYLIA